MFKSPSLFTSNLFAIIFRTAIGLASKDSTFPVTILERSLYSERYCFVQVHRLLCWNHYFIIILDATGVWGYNTRGVCPSWPVVPHPDQPCYHWHGGGPDHLHQEWSRYPHGQDHCKRTAGEILSIMNITITIHNKGRGRSPNLFLKRPAQPAWGLADPRQVPHPCPCGCAGWEPWAGAVHTLSQQVGS